MEMVVVWLPCHCGLFPRETTASLFRCSNRSRVGKSRFDTDGASVSADAGRNKNKSKQSTPHRVPVSIAGDPMDGGGFAGDSSSVPPSSSVRFAENHPDSARQAC